VVFAAHPSAAFLTKDLCEILHPSLPTRRHIAETNRQARGRGGRPALDVRTVCRSALGGVLQPRQRAQRGSSTNAPGSEAEAAAHAPPREAAARHGFWRHRSPPSCRPLSRFCDHIVMEMAMAPTARNEAGPVIRANRRKCRRDSGTLRDAAR
jgi:hypothetical protein